MSVEEARPQVELILKNKKKTEKIEAKMAGSSLATIATANKVTVLNAVDMNIDNPAIPGASYEPKVIGAAFSSKIGQVSKPIEGNSGIYVIATKSVTKAPALPKHSEYITKVQQQVVNYAGRVMPALKNDADIQDNRADFY